MESTTVVIIGIFIAGLILCNWIADNFSKGAALVVGVFIVISTLGYFDIPVKNLFRDIPFTDLFS